MSAFYGEYSRPFDYIKLKSKFKCNNCFDQVSICDIGKDKCDICYKNHCNKCNNRMNVCDNCKNEICRYCFVLAEEEGLCKKCLNIKYPNINIEEDAIFTMTDLINHYNNFYLHL